MQLSSTRARALAGAFLFALVMTSLPAYAAPVDQAGWAARKQSVTLANGQTLAYVEMGDPKGSPVVLLHGWTDTSRSWTLLAPQLEKHRLLILDLRGHGASPTPDCCFAIADFAHDVRLFMDAKRIDRAAIVGHSLGSMIGQALAANHPARVSKLVLVGSTALPPIKRSDWLWSELNGLTAAPARDSQFFRDWTSSPTPVDPAFLRHLTDDTAAVPYAVWRGVLRELVDVPVGRLSPDIKAPTLILAGGKDPLFGADHQAALRAAIPHAQFRQFDDLGHNLNWERPNDVGPALAAFLAD